MVMEVIKHVIIFGGLSLAFVSNYLVHRHNGTVPENKSSPDGTTLAAEERKLFASYDLDGDGCIDAAEFESIAKLLQDLQNLPDLKDEAKAVKRKERRKYDESVDEVVRLITEMKPLNLSTMRQTVEHPKFGTPGFSYPPEFTGLVSWTKPHMSKTDFYAPELSVFLPPNKEYEVGKVYWLFQPPPMREPELSNDRVRPPQPSSEVEEVVFSLLSMFHPRPFVMMRFPPQGGVAVVRARNQLYLDVVFRLHCEFQLNSPPLKPFWFTPSQFAGRVTLSLDGTHVRDLHIQVPSHRKLNVDMEWFVGGDMSTGEMEVDIGHLPLMQIRQPQPSSPLVLLDADGSTIVDRRELWKKGRDVEIEFDKIVWEEEITEDQARGELEKQFFAFKQVEYLPLAEAVAVAMTTGKLLHHVVLWGSLDDQSC